MTNKIHGIKLSTPTKAPEPEKPTRAPEKREPLKIGFLVSSKYIGDFFEISQKTVNKWHHSGCPKHAKGVYDLKKVFAWWVAHIHEGNMETSDESMNAARRKYWWAKARREENREQEEMGVLLSFPDMVSEWSGRMREVTNGLAALKFRLVGLISPFLRDQKDKNAIQEIIEAEQWKLRDNYCRGGGFCPPEKEPEK